MDEVLKVRILISDQGDPKLFISYPKQKDLECLSWITPHSALQSILETQATALKHLIETNDELVSFNKLSEIELEELSLKFKKYLPAIKGMSEDLSAIHKSIGRMKKKLKI
ncbi:unnamed protein product [Blepharisma stoltei]|uniref:KxDL domain-containing protein n=1 Tax=Blepharisma stoltei TaxID=1481888 RepID=A0AAU9IW66_9CILI|nr:unnamed protein product [Blepharisma stoltei]